MKTTYRNFVKGFTLIELILLIMLLGILAAVAAPKFIDIKREARIKVLENAGAQLLSTAELVRYRAIIDGKTQSSLTNLIVNETSVRLIYGWVTEGTIQHVFNVPDSQLKGASGTGGFYLWFGARPSLFIPADYCYVRYSVSKTEAPPNINLVIDGC